MMKMMKVYFSEALKEQKIMENDSEYICFSEAQRLMEIMESAGECESGN